ncbi:MAG: leucine-rich repeat domain-containing protein, partial [Oscillospiraceae bacterium]|nr:leucine-rich repeat domain-containing protein [Oscillospiraceae bacterium]
PMRVLLSSIFSTICGQVSRSDLMKLRRFFAFASAAVIAVSLSEKVCAVPPPPENLDYIEGSYDVIGDGFFSDYEKCTFRKSEDGKNLILLYGHSYDEPVFKVPNRFINIDKETRYITDIRGSTDCETFDLDPKNKYMKLVDNVVFSKDGKKILSYARRDKRTVYEIPDGTEIIGEEAFRGTNLTEISIPDSVVKIENGAFSSSKKLREISIPEMIEEISEESFAYCDELKEVYLPENSKLKKISAYAFRWSGSDELVLTLPSFEIEISSLAFGEFSKFELKSHVKPTVEAEYKNGVCELSWNEIPNAKTYEVYQKFKDGTYKFLKTTENTSVRLKDAKKGRSYTFAVKAIGEIEEKCFYVEHEAYCPISFEVEGAMSDSVTVSVK